MASCLVLSCPIVQQWAVALYWGIRNPRAWMFMELFNCLGTCVIEFYIEHIAFYHDMFTLRLEALWCVCMYPWLSDHFRE
jgi:hypothetical protein